MVTLSKGIFYSSGQCGYKAIQLISLKTHNKYTQSIKSLSTHKTSRGNKRKTHMWHPGLQYSRKKCKKKMLGLLYLLETIRKKLEIIAKSVKNQY